MLLFHRHPRTGLCLCSEFGSSGVHNCESVFGRYAVSLFLRLSASGSTQRELQVGRLRRQCTVGLSVWETVHGLCGEKGRSNGTKVRRNMTFFFFFDLAKYDISHVWHECQDTNYLLAINYIGSLLNIEIQKCKKIYLITSKTKTFNNFCPRLNSIPMAKQFSAKFPDIKLQNSCSLVLESFCVCGKRNGGRKRI